MCLTKYSFIHGWRLRIRSINSWWFWEKSWFNHIDIKDRLRILLEGPFPLQFNQSSSSSNFSLIDLGSNIGSNGQLFWRRISHHDARRLILWRIRCLYWAIRDRNQYQWWRRVSLSRESHIPLGTYCWRGTSYLHNRAYLVFTRKDIRFTMLET